MRRLISLAAAAVFLAGCSACGQLQVTREHADEIGLSFRGPVATDGDGSVFLVAPGNLVRYSPRTNEVERLLRERRDDLADVGVTRDDVVLALCDRSLAAVYAGQLVPLMDLPGRGLQISCSGDYVYMLVATVDDNRALLRWRGGAEAYEPLMLAAGDVAAICAVPDGCLVASGGALHKVFAAEGRAAAEAHRVLLLEAAGMAIRSVAADPAHEVVYISGESGTYAWSGGRIAPFLPVGGRLDYRDGRLTIVSPSEAQVLQVDRPARHLRDVLAATSG
jgi:hypothetical protein